MIKQLNKLTAQNSQPEEEYDPTDGVDQVLRNKKSLRKFNTKYRQEIEQIKRQLQIRSDEEKIDTLLEFSRQDNPRYGGC